MESLSFFQGVRKHMTSSQSIGEKIRLARLKKGLSQEQLALHAGVNPSYLGQIERGVKNPTMNILEKIARGLDLTMERLILSVDGVAASSENKAVLSILTSDEIKRLIAEVINNNRAGPQHADEETYGQKKNDSIKGDDIT